jgi:hypothetical protein
MNKFTLLKFKFKFKNKQSNIQNNKNLFNKVNNLILKIKTLKSKS